MDTRPSQEGAADFSGRNLGVYHLAARIGVGGTATVYQATNICAPREEVAVKVLHRNSDETAIKRFYREIALARRIHVLHAGHHITKVYGHGNEDGLHWAAMELLQGKTLRELLEDIQPGALRWENAAYVVLNVCAALTTMHDLAIVHRDIKPENIFLARTAAGQLAIKLLDLGLATMAGDRDAPDHLGRLTNTGDINGTLPYMSPERIMGDVGSPAGDQYALGVTLYECIHGYLPFLSGEAIQQTATETLRWQERVPLQIRLIAHKALAQSRHDRFPNVRAMGKALHVCLDSTQACLDSKKCLLELLAIPSPPRPPKARPRNFDSGTTRRHQREDDEKPPVRRFAAPPAPPAPLVDSLNDATTVFGRAPTPRTAQHDVTLEVPQAPRCELLANHGAGILRLMKLLLALAMMAIAAMAELAADPSWVKVQKWLENAENRQSSGARGHEVITDPGDPQ